MKPDDRQDGPPAPPASRDAPGLRTLLQARNDALGVHLCDLVEARDAAREGRPADALSALSRSLAYLSDAGSVAGLEVVAVEGLALARDAGDAPLEERLRALVVMAGRADVLAAVLAGLWQESDRLLADGDGARAVGRARCALDLSGLPGDALGLLETSEAAWQAAGRDADAAGARDERLRVAESSGAIDVVVSLLCQRADEALARPDARDAQRLARRALAVAADAADPSVEAAAWRALARVHRAAGDEEGAVAGDARADLLEGAG